ncbi:MAG: FAD-dependent oxidoreductase [Hydrocarboniphaga sp.]|uniref:FAD-binding protein n=1 Tax=Hydrocarboniphaga sp. TaxID=2033016 RepID=UPI0026224411|nr:FAD-binding protein [Hydrocarboniphaga sp.]MDB5968636.1 FAD-dependent oxidoreductase [Hydrocarboniphaga sp.]
MKETFDFVVVGSGGGSLCAALALRAAGKSVLILEKAALVGGTTATSGGVMWIPNNRYMKEAGIPDSREQAIAYLDAVVGDRANMPGASRQRRLAFIDAAPKMIDFLVSQGIRLRRLPSWPDHYRLPGESVPGRGVVSELFDINRLGDWKTKLRPGFLPLPANLDEAMELPNFKRSWAAKRVLFRVIGRALADKITGRQRVTAGRALQAQMLHAALKAGTEIRLNSPVKQILVEDGRVTGVLTQKDGTDWQIGSRLGVLINAGGFAQNQRMRDQFVPGTSTAWSLVPDTDTGEMIEEGLRIGAAVAQMSERVAYQIALPPADRPKPATMQGDMSKPHAIVVDQSGVRYIRESGPTVDFCKGMLERNKTVPAVPSWLVIDSQYLNTYMLAGTMSGSKKPQAWFDSRFLRQADTLEALASECGMDAAKLQASVERFNGFVRKGRDEDFQRGETAYEVSAGDPLHRPSPCLGTLEQGPYFAMQIYPGDVSTFGGLVTDVQARVLRADGSAIPGLYAAGTSTASVMGPVEAGGGGSIGPTLTWAYLAAHHAIAAIA